MGKTSNAVKDRWNAKAYDDVRLRVPAGCKAVIQEAATGADESLNVYIQRSILQRMGLPDWPAVESKPDAVPDAATRSVEEPVEE